MKPKPEPPALSSLSAEALGCRPITDYEERAIDWLWKYRIAKGELTIIAGEGGLGKSQLLLWIAARVSLGESWGDDSEPPPVGRVLIVSAEDSPETTIKPRLMAMNADLSMITIVSATVTFDKPDKPGEPGDPIVMSLQERDYWIEIFNRYPDTAVLIIDPLPSYLGRGVNDSKNNEVRNVLESFLKLAIRPRGISMLTTAHLNKNVDLNKSPLNRVMGSVAYGNLARNNHFVVRCPDDPERRIFCQVKANNSPLTLPACVGFRVESSDDRGQARLPIETAIPIFEAEPVTGFNVSVALAGSAKPERKPTGPPPIETTKLAAWLVDFLQSKGFRSISGRSSGSGWKRRDDRRSEDPARRQDDLDAANRTLPSGRSRAHARIPPSGLERGDPQRRRQSQEPQQQGNVVASTPRFRLLA